MAVKVIENSEQVFHLLIPPKPKTEELTDQELATVSGG